LRLLAPRLVLDAVRLQIAEKARNLNDFQAAGITGRANLEQQKSTQLGRLATQQAASLMGPDRVTTCASQESVERFSLLPSSNSRRQNFWYQIDQIEKNFLRAN
jgi:hypothetical protein